MLQHSAGRRLRGCPIFCPFHCSSPTISDTNFRISPHCWFQTWWMWTCTGLYCGGILNTFCSSLLAIFCVWTSYIPDQSKISWISWLGLGPFLLISSVSAIETITPRCGHPFTQFLLWCSQETLICSRFCWRTVSANWARPVQWALSTGPKVNVLRSILHSAARQWTLFDLTVAICVITPDCLDVNYIFEL